MAIRGRAVAAAVAVLTLAGCTAGATHETTAAARPTASEPADPPAPSPTGTAPLPDASPGATPAPDPTRYLHNGTLTIPRTDPSTWPPANRDPLISDEDFDALLEAYRELGECAPWTLLVDYDAGLLSPEEYTAYAAFAMAPALPGRAHAPGLDLPERYALCPGPDALQLMGFEMGLFFDDVDPAFLDAVWLAAMGETYTEAHRTLTDEEFEAALDYYVQATPTP